jgi:hypothetical protein
MSDDGNTVPVGKTQEEADAVAPKEELHDEVTRLAAANVVLQTEANRQRHKIAELEADAMIAADQISDLTANLDESESELKQTLASNNAMARREVALSTQITELRVSKPRWSQVGVSVFMLVVCLGTLACTLSVYRSVIEHLDHLTPPPVECPVCETPAEPTTPTTPTTVAASDGYLIEDENGMPHMMPWPDASLYPAAVFIDDCRAVCTVPAPLDRDDTPGRVLVADPEHLLCICFHAEHPWPITRWINWERVR